VAVSQDRYALAEFEALRRDFSSIVDNDQSRLGQLLRRSEIIYTSSKGMHHPRLTALPLQLHLANSTATNVGRMLLDLDVELRRAASYLRSGSLRPSRNNQIVEVISAQHVASIDIVVAAAQDIYQHLTSRPIDFLLLLNWFWSHRYHRTKVRLAYEEINPVQAWKDVVEMAEICIETGRPVIITMEVDRDGSTQFGLQSE
jgi:hypothetical protein